MAYNFFSNHFIRIFCRRLGLPRALIYDFVRALSFVSPNSFEQKHIIAPDHLSDSSLINRELGYFRFDKGISPILNNVVADCTHLFDTKHSQYDEAYFVKNPNKGFLLTLAADQELMGINSIHKLITSDLVINAVYSYLRQPFVLGAVRLWWSRVNDSEIRSQKFHLDDEDLSQVKLFININDVSEEHGPFRFIDAKASKKIIGQYKHGKRRFTDDEISASGDDVPMISLTGASGEGGFVDTSRCLHFGSRANRYDRLVLMAQFLKFDAPLLKSSIPVYDCPGSYGHKVIGEAKNQSPAQ